jgi:hypothetical protein
VINLEDLNLIFSLNRYRVKSMFLSNYISPVNLFERRKLNSNKDRNKVSNKSNKKNDKGDRNKEKEKE